MQRFALAGAYSDVPGNVCVGIRSFFNALVIRIAKGDAILSVQLTVGFSDVTDITGGAAHDVYQARLGIHANVSFHAEVPLVGPS